MMTIKDAVKWWNAYTERCDVFFAALKQLDKEYPPATPTAAVDRAVMRDRMKSAKRNDARLFAIASGIPRERIEAIEALIF